MKNFKQVLSLFLISAMVLGMLISCVDKIETIDLTEVVKLEPTNAVEQKAANEAFKKAVEERIKNNKNADLNDLSLKYVTSLEGLFKGNKDFNGDISKWNVSKVENFKSMFEGSTFNGNISDWKLEAAKNMQFMFKDNEAFDQDLSSWQINADTTLFASIFKDATKMLKTVTGVTNAKMPEVIKARYDKMVRPSGTSAANLKSLMTTEIAKNGNGADYNYIDTSDTVSFERLFGERKDFNGKINDWDTSKVTNIKAMFYNAESFNQPIGNWDTSKVSNMNYMFFYAIAFNQPIGNWDTSKVTTMNYMFFDAKAFNQPIGNWDTSKVTTMNRLFYGASVFNQPIGNWDVSKVTDINSMFNKATAFNQDLNEWNNKLNNATLIQNLNKAEYKENIFKNSAMQKSNKPQKLR